MKKSIESLKDDAIYIIDNYINGNHSAWKIYLQKLPKLQMQVVLLLVIDDLDSMKPNNTFRNLIKSQLF